MRTKPDETHLTKLHIKIENKEKNKKRAIEVRHDAKDNDDNDACYNKHVIMMLMMVLPIEIIRMNSGRRRRDQN